MKSKKPKIGRYIILLLLSFVIYLVFFTWTITPPSSVYLKKGDTIQTFLESLSWIQRMRMKLYITRHTIDTNKIQTWTYVFSWSYNPEAYMNAIVAWPTQDYIRYTMLEWWSLYDVDANMADKWLIEKWALLRLANDTNEIQKLSETFSFLKQNKPLKTLEWFLYPDTYFLSTNSDILWQFLKASLTRFDEKIIPIWTTYSSDFTNRISEYSLTFSLPGAVNLASIIEKEERATKEKSTIAWIFLNRLSQNIQLGADITLCYGREQPYETCTPKIIATYIHETTNQYNTRVFEWLPPTPISSITADTFYALLNFKKVPYLFYLHDNQWNIHYAETNAQHEENKKNYLQ